MPNERFGDHARRKRGERLSSDLVDSKGSAQRNPVTGTLRYGGTVPQVIGLVLEQSPGAIEASWDSALIADLKRYEIQISTSAAFVDPTIRYAAETQFTFEDGVAGTDYYIRVRAFNTGNEDGAWSLTETLQPGAVTAADIADGSITTNKIGNLQVTNAKINDVAASKITGTISTSQIAAEAVHIEDLTFTSGSVVNSGTTELQWATENITSAGNEIKIDFRMAYLFNGGTTDGSWVIRLRDGTGGGGTIRYSLTIQSDSGAVGYHTFAALLALTPGAGSTTYEATITRTGGDRDITVINRTIWLNEIER